MKKEEFARLFEHALEVAAQNAETKLGHDVPRQFCIEVHGGGSPGFILKTEDALDVVWLGSDRFYKLIDVGVKEIRGNVTIVFLGIAGYVTDSFDQSWNQPIGSGPFKQILANEIKEID